MVVIPVFLFSCFMSFSQSLSLSSDLWKRGSATRLIYVIYQLWLILKIWLAILFLVVHRYCSPHIFFSASIAIYPWNLLMSFFFGYWKHKWQSHNGCSLQIKIKHYIHTSGEVIARQQWLGIYVHRFQKCFPWIN